MVDSKAVKTLACHSAVLSAVSTHGCATESGLETYTKKNQAGRGKSSKSSEIRRESPLGGKKGVRSAQKKYMGFTGGFPRERQGEKCRGRRPMGGRKRKLNARRGKESCL